MCFPEEALFVSEVVGNFLEEVLKEEIDSVEDVRISETLKSLVPLHQFCFGEFFALVVFFNFHFQLVYFCKVVDYVSVDACPAKLNC